MIELTIFLFGFITSFIPIYYALNKCDYCWNFFTKERCYSHPCLGDRTGGLTLCEKHNKEKPWLK